MYYSLTAFQLVLHFNSNNSSLKKGAHTMKDLNLDLLVVTIIVSFSIILLLVGFEITAWERANNFPFGKLCDVYNSCK